MAVEQQARGAASGATGAGRRRSRRDEILEIAVGLFAARGYHGVSMDDIGAAAGVTGPALYHHFAGKEAMLVAALIPVSEGLLAGGRERVVDHPDDPRGTLESLIDFHVEFALADPAGSPCTCTSWIGCPTSRAGGSAGSSASTSRSG